MCLFIKVRDIVRVTFCAARFCPQNFKTYLNNSNPNNKFNSTKKPSNILFGDLGLSLGVGVAMGSMTAGIMRRKRLPNIFSNSFEIGSVFGYLTYMGTLIATPFKTK